MRFKGVFFKILNWYNFIYFEINPRHRFQFLLNHITNSFFHIEREIPTCKISLKSNFVISLNFRKDRRCHIEKNFLAAGIKFIFLDGVWFNHQQTFAKYFSKRSWNYLSHGALGCILSHISIMEKIAALPEEALYLIFEDDVILTNKFADSLIDLSNNFPEDCDIFFLGSRNSRARDIKYFTSHNYCRSYNPRMGAYAYAITPKGAKKLLSYLLPINLICGGIDTAIGILVRDKKINAYQFYPTLVYHDNNISSNIFNPSAKKKKLDLRTIKQWPLYQARKEY